MCGITGIAGFRDDDLLLRMNEAIHHRGPDDDGVFLSDEHSLGNRRLSIIDLGNGHQPMAAADGKVQVVFNGEIYNFRQLRQDLIEKGHSFQTDCDTEVVLHAYLEYGVDAPNHFNGMFAFAISDMRERPVLHIFRDRLGIKPLYYYFKNGRLLFSSELKSLLQYPHIDRSVNPKAAFDYLTLRYVPGDDCLLNGIQKLPAASLLTFAEGTIAISHYWAAEFPESCRDVSFESALEQVDYLLGESVKRRMIADVPVGAYLSGGVDSSLLVAMMRKFSSSDIKTFSIGFEGEKEGELSLAAATARQLGTDHHEIVCSEADFELVPQLMWYLDEPVGDPIVLPMFLLAKRAREHVKAVLSGEGADEVFGGYLFQKVLEIGSMWKRFSPAMCRNIANLSLAAMPHQILNLFFQYPASLGAEGKQRLLQYSRALEVDSVDGQFRALVALFDERSLLESAFAPALIDSLRSQTFAAEDKFPDRNSAQRILANQYHHWLPDDILMKLDKMTMANSLEGRVPFMDHTLVEYAVTLPPAYMFRGWKDKRLLRALSRKYIAPETAGRKKRPFYLPLNVFLNSRTYRNLYARFQEENYLHPILNKGFLGRFRLEDQSLLGSKQLFALLSLNEWVRQYSDISPESLTLR